MALILNLVGKINLSRAGTIVGQALKPLVARLEKLAPLI
jgi:hypothetical protein